MWVFASLLLILPTPVFGQLTQAWYSWSYDTYNGAGRPETTGWSSAIDMGGGNSATVWFGLYQLATPTAVTSPTATVVSPIPTDTVPPSPVPPPAGPTETLPPPAPGDTVEPTATVGAGETPATATQPATVAPTSTPLQPKASPPEPTQEPATATAPVAPPPQLAISTQEITTMMAILEAEGEAPTTYTARVAAPSGSLLDRLTYNKPGIWGNKAFYVGLAVVYVVLLVLFFRLLFQIGRQSDEGG